MKKKSKNIVSLLLVVITLFQFVAISFAADVELPADDPIIEEYVNIDECSCYCNISGITLYGSASLTAKSSMYLQIIIEVQKLTSGEYKTIETWSDSKTGTSLSLSDDRLINVFSTYRIKVTFTAGSESTTLYSYA
ncbi:MAG: hypothetical protein IJJ85_09005 [Clostridia bacterium]|nr:hypothetical protein [Clostridia bacterium]